MRVRRGVWGGLREGPTEGINGGDQRGEVRRGFWGGAKKGSYEGAYGGDLRRGSRRGFTKGYTTELGGVPLELILLIILMCTGTS